MVSLRESPPWPRAQRALQNSQDADPAQPLQFAQLSQQLRQALAVPPVHAILVRVPAAAASGQVGGVGVGVGGVGPRRLA